MKKVLDNMPHQFIALFACFMVILGLFWARAIFATGIILLLGNAIVNGQVKQIFTTFFSHKVFISISLIFIVYLVSGLWSTNMHYFAHKVQLHLPFLAIPIGILSFTTLSTRHLIWIFYAFIIGCLGGAIWSSVQYFSHKEMYDIGYGLSKVIPTPFKKDHIRFSIAVVMAIWFAYFCILHEKNNCIRIVTKFTIGLFIIYLHILSVKTGLLAFYLLLFFVVMHFIFIQKKYAYGFVILAIAIAMPVVAFYTSTSFKNKMYYMQYSISAMFNHTQETNISDEGRLISYRFGTNIIKNNAWIGVGAGDVMDAMTKQYALAFADNKEIEVLLPHNQCMMMMLVAGIFGGIIYIIFLCLPLLIYYRQSLLFTGFWVVLLVPQLVEPLHETQYGITIHIFFYALIVRYLDLQQKQKNILPKRD
jgi:O-antigen ligase